MTIKTTKIPSLLIILLLISSCGNPVKKVLSNEKWKDEVGHAWEKENPCGNGIIEYIPGDTVVRVDSSYAEENIDKLNGVIDSLTRYAENQRAKNIPVNIDSLRKILEAEALLKCHPKTIYKFKTDTVKWEDTRRINELNKEIAFYKGQSQQVLVYSNNLEKKLRIAHLEIAGLLVLLGLGIFLKIRGIL